MIVVSNQTNGINMTGAPDLDTSQQIHAAGHREFVGGDDKFWNEIKHLQFNLLLSMGLRPEHIFIDVACGSLRGGCQFIPYLNVGNYLGIDKHIELIIYGVSDELGIDLFKEKQPVFVISDRFEFSAFRKSPDFGLAQSLFSHLTENDIVECLMRLREIAAQSMRFFVTFHETETAYLNPEQSHSLAYFAYTNLQMIDFGRRAGWKANLIGDWKHPRNQKLIEYNPC